MSVGCQAPSSMSANRLGPGSLRRFSHTPGEYWPLKAAQQLVLSETPDGYCLDQGTGVACPIGLAVTADAALT